MCVYMCVCVYIYMYTCSVTLYYTYKCTHTYIYVYIIQIFSVRSPYRGWATVSQILRVGEKALQVEWTPGGKHADRSLQSSILFFYHFLKTDLAKVPSDHSLLLPQWNPLGPHCSLSASSI